MPDSNKSKIINANNFIGNQNFSGANEQWRNKPFKTEKLTHRAVPNRSGTNKKNRQKKKNDAIALVRYSNLLNFLDKD